MNSICKLSVIKLVRKYLAEKIFILFSEKQWPQGHFLNSLTLNLFEHCMVFPGLLERIWKMGTHK